jgi:hypothetical protein
MALTPTERAVMEIRELLVTTQNKDQVVRVLKHRGIDEDEARSLVLAVYKQNLWDNRKTSLWAALGSGTVFVILLVVWFATGQLFYIWLPLSGLSMTWFIIKCCTASGYQIEEDDE